MTGRPRDDAVYRGSDGRYYTGWQLRSNLDSGSWRPCLFEIDTDRRLVGIDDGELLFLDPVDPDELPPWIVIDVHGWGRRAIDTRSVLPSSLSQGEGRP